MKESGHYDPAIHMLREKEIKRLLLLDGKKRRNLWVEAQGGHGKSVFVSQYLNYIDADFVWYSMTEADADPITFIRGIALCLAEFSDHFSETLVTRRIECGEISPDNLDFAADLISLELKKLPPKRRPYIVLDDLHNVSASPVLLGFLGKLCGALKKIIPFACITRNRVGTDLEAFRDLLHPIVIGYDFLAMDIEETACLFREHFSVDLDEKALSLLMKRTEGWMMGILSHALHYSCHKESVSFSPEDALVDSMAGHLGFFFQEEIFDGISKNLLPDLMRLALVENIPLSLAMEMTGNPKIGEALEALCASNYFTRQDRKHTGVYHFHHLFREYLRNEAEKNLPPEILREALCCAADFYLRFDELETALGLCVKAENLSKFQDILKDAGARMLSENRIITLTAFLSRISDKVADQYPWISLYQGVVCLDTRPSEALSYLLSARDRFVSSGDEQGELLALAHIIHYYATIDAQFKRGRGFLLRAERLFEAHGTELSVYCRIQALIFLAIGSELFMEELETARSYTGQALALAQRHGLTNFMAEARLNRGFLCMFQCDYKGFYQEMEILHPFRLNPGISAHTRMMILLAMLNLLEEDGDFFTYRFYRDRLDREVGDNLLQQSILSPFLSVWDTDAAIAEGNEEEAWRITQEMVGSGRIDQSPHFYSQIHQYQAFLCGRRHDAAGVRANAEKALSMRDQVEYTPLYVLCHTSIGMALGFCGQQDAAITHLAEGIRLSVRCNETYIRTSAHIHRARILEDSGKEYRDDLETAVQLLRENRHCHLALWVPDVMRRFLHTAIIHDIHPEFCRELALARLGLAFTGHGDPIPALFIDTLGDSMLRIEGKKIAGHADLTQKQQALFSILLSVPGKSISVEKLQTLLWPESSPAKGRSSFDSMLSRFRKTVDTHLYPGSSHHYFPLKNGTLSLTGCRVDADRFIAHAEEGRARHARGEFWQAANAFRKALTLYRGEYLPGMALDHFAVSLKEHRLVPLLESCLNLWCDIFQREGDGYPEDLDLIESRLTREICREPICETLKEFYRRRGNIRGAKRMAMYLHP
ncbi:BTAD domain-containing putative transcriptional regulator [Desulfoluna sp.]|uniref:BTAD domain-containing putative transcriptional regulator n=1 Tax=Desulfoluna sp. TaxID=2045199 RepID=UPI00260D44EA|nr:BTAD domain-containing putative transcriptional regulator [Desulfoluna sp.]